MQHLFATDVTHRMVYVSGCLLVCVLVTQASCAKKAELIKMLFWGLTV